MIRAGRLYLLLIVTLLAGATALRLADPFFVQALRLIVFDFYQRLEPATFDPNFRCGSSTSTRICSAVSDSGRGRARPWPIS